MHVYGYAANKLKNVFVKQLNFLKKSFKKKTNKKQGKSGSTQRAAPGCICADALLSALGNSILEGASNCNLTSLPL